MPRSLESAVDQATSELAAELRAAKTREDSLMKRGGRAMKSLLRGFQP